MILASCLTLMIFLSCDKIEKRTEEETEPEITEHHFNFLVNWATNGNRKYIGRSPELDSYLTSNDKYVSIDAWDNEWGIHNELPADVYLYPYHDNYYGWAIDYTIINGKATFTAECIGNPIDEDNDTEWPYAPCDGRISYRAHIIHY